MKFATSLETKFIPIRGVGLSGVAFGLIIISITPSFVADFEIFSELFFQAQYEMPSAFLIKSFQSVGAVGGENIAVGLGEGVTFGSATFVGVGEAVGVGSRTFVGAGEGDGIDVGSF